MSAKISKAVRDAIADPFALGDAQSEWTLPEVLPPIAELRAALAALRADLEPTAPKDARWCLGKMRQRFGIGTAEIDAAAWLKALQSFPRNMIFEAVRIVVTDDKRPTLESFTRHPGLVRRQTDLARAEAILAALIKPKPVAPVERPPAAVRLRQCRDAALSRRDAVAAAKWARELAAAEGREPQAWVVESEKPAVAPAVDQAPAPAIEPSARNKVLMLRARARWWRKNRLDPHAARLEAEADALDPQHIEEPIGEDYEQGAAA
ncbi:hypothetical protein [Reyranella sp.]|jgi:hypothetical protein|uniref:hypothetical protein n=1 Tax=Reyranella sp. TaxID=1929291 RepID=UPI000BCAC606|nr:hypothetical protein [Reyranella sp.]OYY35571.1 MAG: hypothetical protein B7Y57_25670 [Rhodospirillales bacterium 35-66-84]OYZ91441.1 MAG: hypothetical protein B7Y08_25540 [Rhodospirillales bacterium 24-66-33]OZB21978.1 MAG: hypothetical protein B7X63_24465 [Rhodospirillales bacterium 39-66-50]HQS15008.1 hypothetical protein [Reyranella sp.]HQT10817.1 hypothetical protein [Reyranella sp.]